LALHSSRAFEIRLLARRVALPGAKEEPARAATERPHVVAAAEEDRPAQLVDGLVGALHHVERVVDDGDVLELRVALDRVS
jgi:hypothetical protein